MDMRSELMQEINAFLKRTGMSPTSFGTESIGDRTLMISLRRGRDLKLRTVEKIRAFMQAYVPEEGKARQKKAA